MDTARLQPLAGRQRELESLDAALTSATRRLGGVVSIVGEPGIGKTRLAEECAARAGRRGFSVAWGAGWSDGGMPPDWPWHELLDRLEASDAAALLGDDRRAAAVGGQLERFAMYRAIGAAVARAAESRPLLIVIDDAHAVDPGALQLTRFAARSLRTCAVCFLLTCRLSDPAVSDETAELLAALVGEGVRLEPAALGAGEAAELLRWAGRPADDDAVGVLLELTGGNPLLIHEVLSTRQPVGESNRLRRLLHARLQPFGSNHMTSLAAAAVLGPSATVETVAAVAGIVPEAATLLRQVARDSGLLAPGDGRGFVFAHGLLREALLGEVGAETVARLRSCAADVLATAAGPTTVQRLSHVAGLRIGAAAQLGGDAVTTAIEATLAASRSDRGQYGYESTAPLLRAACRMLEDGGHQVPNELLLELASAEFARGRLADASSAYRRIVDASGGTGPDGPPTAVMVEAVLGLGGLSGFEHRTAVEKHEFRSLLDRATVALGDDRADLRARLAARAAAEAWYDGSGSLDDVVVAVDRVRATSDDSAAAESMSLLHHVLLGPEWGDERRELADALMDAAHRAGDGFLAVMSVMWRTVDLFLAGDAGAERSLNELRQRADALQIRLAHYVSELIDVMLLIRAGRLDEAEAESAKAFEHGVEIGEADAGGYYAGHLLILRWLQGRTAEIVDVARSVAAAPTVLAGDEIYRAAFAAVAAIAGGVAADDAQGELDRLSTLGLDRMPSGSNWLVTMFTIVEAAAALGDRRAAAAAYEALLPHVDLPVMGSLASLCLGPVSRSLGIAARTLGRLDAAVGHLEQAVIDGRRLANRPVLAITRGDLALTLLQRRNAGDPAVALSMASEAIAALRSMGLDRRAEALQADLDRAASGVGGDCPATDTPPPAPEVDPSMCRLHRLTDGAWEIAGLQERAIVRHSHGMEYLARLLANPGVDIAADELAGVAVAAALHEVLDDRARSAYRRRVEALRAELDAADDAGDERRSALAQQELDRLLAELSTGTGFGGRHRAFADSRERARTAVQKALRRTMERVAEEAPALGAALSEGVRTGLHCRFETAPGQTWQVRDDHRAQMSST